MDRMIANTDGGVPLRSAGALTRPSFLGRSPLAADPCAEAIGATQRWLLDRQHAEGYWVGELEGDTILESEYILLMGYLGREREAACVKAARYIYEQERAGGGWAIYPGGPADLSASVKAYFALKLVGVPTDDPVMVRARELILEAGGARAYNSFTRFYLALLGQIGYDECPSVPPELVLLPKWFGLCL